MAALVIVICAPVVVPVLSRPDSYPKRDIFDLLIDDIQLLCDCGAAALREVETLECWAEKGGQVFDQKQVLHEPLFAQRDDGWTEKILPGNYPQDPF
jgi:hypothetical protein